MVQGPKDPTIRGSFVFTAPEVRRIVAAAEILGQEVVGTFHSHPVGVPVPGMSDVEHAVEDSLMFLFDCIGRGGQLWRISNGEAQPVEFGFAQRSLRTTTSVAKATARPHWGSIPDVLGARCLNHHAL